MTISSKYQSLISALLDATAERKIKWEKINDPNEFQTVINKNTVSEHCSEYYVALGDCDNKPRYSLQLKTKDGVVIDSYAGENSYIRNEPEFLYDVARRSYYKVEETIDGLISKLS